MKGLITLVAVIAIVGAFQAQTQSSWSFKTEEPKQPEFTPADFTSAGLINSGLNSLGREPEQRTARFDFSLQMQLPANK